MSDVGDDNFVRYIFRGEEGEVIPDDATHIFISIRVVRAHIFRGHPNIIEVVCHEHVDKIENGAFGYCKSLRRVIMPGVTIVDEYAFGGCRALADVKFGSKLERLERGAFCRCTSLEQITIPLKDGLFPDDCTFIGCKKLKQVDLVEGGLHETIAALQLEEWRNDMYEKIDSINQTLPFVPAGNGMDFAGEKAIVIRYWIRSVLVKINGRKAEHRRVLDEEIAPSLQHCLPQDIVRNSVLPFLALPPKHWNETVGLGKSRWYRRGRAL